MATLVPDETTDSQKSLLGSENDLSENGACVNSIAEDDAAENTSDEDIDEAEEVRSRSDSFDRVSINSGISSFTNATTVPAKDDDPFNLDDLETASNISLESRISNPMDSTQLITTSIFENYPINEAVQIITYLGSLDPATSAEWRTLHMTYPVLSMFKAYINSDIRPKSKVYNLLEANPEVLKEYLPEPDYMALVKYEGIDHSRYVKGGTMSAFALALKTAMLGGQSVLPWNLTLATARQLLLEVELAASAAVLPMVVVGAGFAVVESAYYIIWKWLWKKDITGLEAAKYAGSAFASATVATLGSIGGGMLGLVLAGGNPIGMMVGGAIGGGLASLLTELGKKLYREFFSGTKNGGLDAAYKFMHLQKTVSNEGVVSAYKALAKVYHPDRGGNEDDFKKLVTAYLIIRAARGMDQEPSDPETNQE